jgi:hypothetical protein
MAENASWRRNRKSIAENIGMKESERKRKLAWREIYGASLASAASAAKARRNSSERMSGRQQLESSAVRKRRRHNGVTGGS